MSRIETLKEQYPQLDISLLDLLIEIDDTKSHKYVQFLCKLLNKSHSFESFDLENNPHFEEEVNNTLGRYGFKKDKNKSVNYIKLRLLEMFYRLDDVNSFHKFKEYMERGLIVEKDITKYSNFDEILQHISLCEIKMEDKELQKQVYKEYEDDKWLLVRPLSFQSSEKYGAGTKWCTTFNNEKHYFFKYFYNGGLVYIINKLTGYKVGFYGDEGNEKLHDVSFWGADDKRYDFVDLELDEYLLSEIKRIIKENKTNAKFLQPMELFDVATYCNSIDRLLKSDVEMKCAEFVEPIVSFDINTVQPTMRA